MDKREDFIKVTSPKVRYSEDYIEADYEYLNTIVKNDCGIIEVCPTQQQMKIRTGRRVGRVGVMLVGWGGNNGSTFTAAVIANRNHYTWHTKTGLRSANWYGSITQASTVRIGVDRKGKEVYLPMSQMLPMVHPDDLYVDGWDISRANLAESMVRAQVIDYDLQQQLHKEMLSLRPRPSIYNPDFIAANQADRATNLIEGSKLEQFEQIRRDIREFKSEYDLDKVIVLWTANTERFCDVSYEIHGTPENLMKALANNKEELSPSTIFAMAAISEKCCYINGSPQNTFVPGVIEMALKNEVFIGGDDFKSGQTKFKSVLVDFLVTAGIKPTSIVSYNHLGNNDGKNLSAPEQFRSKEISKSNVVDDMVASNSILYGENEKPDHVVVIKYVPYVGDSKRAMDEYTSEILLGGLNTIAVHNTCEDSLLAVPIILDLVILTELFTRIKLSDDTHEEYCGFHSVLTPLSYLLKAPVVPDGTPVINALFKQRACIENIMRACLGLAPESNMLLEHKVPFMMAGMNKGDTEDVSSKPYTQPPLKKVKTILNGNKDSFVQK